MTFYAITSNLTAAQCRSLLKIGRPLTWHPPSAWPVGMLRAQVDERIRDGEIPKHRLDSIVNPKPRSTTTIKRCTGCTIRDAGRPREPFVGVSPNGTISVRLEGTKRIEYTTVAAVYAMAVKQRVAAERSDKARAKKARKG